MLHISITLFLAALATAQLTPTAPGPGEVFNARSSCFIQWNADTTGAWNNVTIDLMSGSNNNMSVVTNVATGLDGTSAALSPYNWTCPEVTPYSAIYFYQFKQGVDSATAAWTTRFTIASPTGESTPPENSQQPGGGGAIPWGTGALAVTSASASTKPLSDGQIEDSGAPRVSAQDVPAISSAVVPIATAAGKNRLPSSAPAAVVAAAPTPTLSLPLVLVKPKPLAYSGVDLTSGASRTIETGLLLLLGCAATTLYGL